MRKTSTVFWLLFAGTTASAAPVISPSSATVYVSNTVQFTSTDTVTWSLASGSTGTITAGGLYTAPGPFASKNVIAGCPVAPNDHIFNTRIDNLPVHSSSTARINNMVPTSLGFEISFPLNIFSDVSPTTSMTFRYTPNNDGPFPLLPFPYRGEEGSALSNDPFFQDHHILGVSTTTCKAYEMYQFFTVGADATCPTCNSYSGVSYSGMTYALPDTTGDFGGGTDAAGMALLPLSMRFSELKAGSINHALRFSLNNGNIYSGFLWPAVAFTNQCATAATCVPYGSRFRLKSTFNISGYSPTAQVILTALKQYGMILVDGGTAMRVQTMTDVTSDTTTWTAILSEIPQVSTVAHTNFEQVDESSLMVSSATGHVNLSNPYVVPSNFAEVIATKTSDSSTATLRIAIQPVTVGTMNIPFPANSGTLSVMAGTPQFQIPYWVKGATTTTVTCSMSPSVGTLTSGCLYTAPTSFFNSLATTTVTIAPTAAPAQSVSFPLVIFSSDGIRLRQGPKSAANSPSPSYDADGNYTDANGRIWWNDPIGNLPSFYTRQDIFSPQASWGSATDIALFYASDYGSQDKAYAAMVPNGNYLLRMGFGVDNSITDVQHSTATIDSQSSVVVSSVSLVHAIYTPNIITSTVSVTSNQFYFAIRGVSESSHVLLNNWSLTPIAATTPSAAVNGSFKGNGTIKGKGTWR